MGDVLARLENHGVAAQQRRERLPRRNRERKIERRDEPRHTDRPAIAHGPFVREFAGNGVSEQPASLGRGVVRRVDSLLHVASRLGERLSHFPRHQVGDLFLSRREQVSDAPQHVATRRRRRPFPLLESAHRRRAGLIHVGFARQRKAADHVARVGRVGVVTVPAGDRWHPRTPDEILPRLHCTLRNRSS